MAYIKHNTRTVRNPNTCPYCSAQVAYWAHDTSSMGKAENRCEEHNSMSWVYLTIGAKDVKAGERVDYRHVHFCPGMTEPHYYDGPKPGKDSGADDVPEPEPKPKPEVKPEVNPNDPMEALKAVIRSVAGETVDMAEVEHIVDLRLADARADMLVKTGDLIKATLKEIGALPTRVIIEKPGQPDRKIEGLAHSVLPNVIKILSLKRHVFMVGPAGTGKTHIGMQAADALELPYYPMSVGPTMLESKLLGYMDATGNFVSTPFYEWCKKGGIFLLDECDNGNPSVLNVLNSALSNGHVLFPNGELVELHETCRAIAAANTYGGGADAKYVGRQALDAAFKDRFVFLDVPVDLALERALCQRTGLPVARVDRALGYVRHLRKNAEDAKLPVVIGPRGATMFCDLLQAGFSHVEAENMALRKGVSSVDWKNVTMGAPLLSMI